MDIDRRRDPYVIDPDALSEWVSEQLRWISQGKLAKALNTSAQSIIRWKRGEIRHLYEEQIDSIVQFEKKSTEDVLKRLGAARPRNVEISADLIYIPVYDVSAGAGNGVNPLSHEMVVSTLAFDRGWLRSQLGSVAEKAEGITIRGDSMEPTLRDGDVVLIDRYSPDQQDGVFLIRVDGDLVVKRVTRMGHLVRLISDNQLYSWFDVDPATQDFEILGRVCMKCQKI